MTMLKPLRVAAIAVIAVAASIASVQPASAIFCANCGTEWTQLLNNVELVKQLEQQLALVQNAISQYKLMLTNSNPLANQTWSNALGEMQRLNSLLAQAKSLSFASGNLDGQFAKKYGDYKSYVSGQIGADQLSAKYQQWSEDTNASVLTTLKAAGLQNDQINGDEDAYLRQLQKLSETAKGQMQALQISNQIAIALARQTQKLRQLMLVQMQLQANYIQQQMDREAAQSAAWRNFTKKPDVSIGNGKRY